MKVRTRIAAVGISFGLLFSVGGTAHADSACNNSLGYSCGKVENLNTSIKNLTMVDQDTGLSKSVPPGYGSRSSAYYIKDVGRIYIPMYTCAVVYSGQHYWTWLGGKSYTIANSATKYSVRIKNAGTC